MGPYSWMSVLCCQADSGDLHLLPTFTGPSEVSELLHQVLSKDDWAQAAAAEGREGWLTMRE